MPAEEASSEKERRDVAAQLRIDVLTLFPELFSGFLEASLLGKARARGLMDVALHDFRAFATDRHRTVDDKPYGGGPGMVLMCEPILACLDSLGLPPGTPRPAGTRLVMLTPQGDRLEQRRVQELARAERLVLLCGRYEGFDERLRDILEPEEISVGDYILTGGEPAAMILIDAVSRLVPGVLGHDASAEFESHDPQTKWLDYPVYTRPPEVRGHKVPEVLFSGDHEAVARWRLEQAKRRTRERRPDLLAATEGSRQGEGASEREEERLVAERIRRMAEVSRQQRRGRHPNKED